MVRSAAQPDDVSSLARPASRAVVFLGRCGFAARGLIYVAVGVLAGLAAAGSDEGETTDPQGAATTIGQLPGGVLLLFVAGAGLAGYALWRFAQATFNLEQFKGPHQGLGWRLWFVFDGLFHAGFAFMVFSVARGTRGGTVEDEADDWTQRVMGHPFGEWLVALGGVVAIGVGLYTLVRAFTIRHRDYLSRRIEQTWKATAVVTASRIGESGRAVVFVIVGAFLLRAAWHFNPDEAIGVAGALQALRAQPGGRVWLGLIAVGLAAYGVLSGLEARYRKIGHGGLLKEDGEEEA